MIKYLYINGERIKARGSKYFNYHGKRLMIEDYLQKNSIKPSPLNDDTGDTEVTNDIKANENREIINSIDPSHDAPLLKSDSGLDDRFISPGANKDTSFHNIRVSFNGKDGGFVFAPDEKKPIVKRGAPNKGSPDLESPSEETIIKPFGAQQFNALLTTQKLDVANFPSRDIGEMMVIGSLLTAGLLMKGEQPKEW